MTQVGHTFTGLAIGVACMPENMSRRGKVIQLLAFGLLANLPDFPFKGWGHDRYYFSHSLFVNLALIFGIAAVLICFPGIRSRLGSWTIITGGFLAWLSHLLLDTFYNHAKGLPMFWPFSAQRLSLPISWFEVVRVKPPPFTPEFWRILLVEFVTYGAFFVIIVGLKKFGAFGWINKRRT